MASCDDEHQGLQEAIEESLKERSSTTTVQFGDLAPRDSNSEKAKPPLRASIDDRIKEITLQPALELPLINDPSGDTWVYIDPPSKQPEQDDLDYSRYLKRYETPMLVKKKTLLKYHVPSPNEGFNFEALFGPSAQFRTVRRRNLTTKLREHPRVKYVIDLTPPTEGDDAVFLTTELCCSQGVRLWYQAGDIWSVSELLVGGKEEYTSHRRQDLVHVHEPWSICNSANSSKSPSLPSRTDGKRRFLTTSENSSMPSEYSPVRHRSAIERVIAALVGIDPKLDSAPKVWTTFAVANYFCLKNSPVTDYIVRWLRATPNSFFLEVCPEVSLRMADGLENHDLARDTFAILVGEEALDSLFRARMPQSNNCYSVYGRKKENLPEKIFSRIEYASKHLQERVRSDYEDFAGFEMIWVESLPEVQKLLSIKEPSVLSTVHTLICLLKDYVRGTVNKLLYVNYDYVPAPDFYRAGGNELIRRSNRAEVWATLSPDERILSRTFWHSLVSFTLFEGNTNLDIKNGWGFHWKDGLTQEEKHGWDRNTCRLVRNQDLNSLIWEGNRLLAQQQHKRSYMLPDRTRSHVELNPLDPNNLPTNTGQPFASLSDAPIALKKEPSSRKEPAELINIPQNALKADSLRIQCDHDLLPNTPLASQDNATTPSLGVSLRDADVAYDDWHHKSLESDVTNECDQGAAPGLSQRQAPRDFSSFPDQNKAKSWDIHDSEPLDRKVQDARSNPPFFGQPQNSLGQKLLPNLRPTETESEKSSAPRLAKTPFFDFQEFCLQARLYIETTARRKLQYADHQAREEPHEIGITNTLVCLEDTEWKYLPMWAGGYDDDSGGVFNDQLPSADLGFSTCGPDVHTGITPTNSDMAVSDFCASDNECDVVTVNTSMVNNRSFAGVLERKRVYAADSIDSLSGDDYEMVTVCDDYVEENARKQTEAQERLEAAEEEAAREGFKLRKDKEQLIDENYADLFNGCEDDDGTECPDDEDSFMHDDSEDDAVMV